MGLQARPMKARPMKVMLAIQKDFDFMPFGILINFSFTFVSSFVVYHDGLKEPINTPTF